MGVERRAVRRHYLFGEVNKIANDNKKENGMLSASILASQKVYIESVKRRTRKFLFDRTRLLDTGVKRILGDWENFKIRVNEIALTEP